MSKKDDDQVDSPLSDPQRLAIRDYLREQILFWTKLVGFTSAFAVVAGLIAFIFWLPKSAAVQAKELIVSEIATERQQIQKEAADTRASLSATKTEIEKLQAEKDNLVRQIAELQPFLKDIQAYSPQQRADAVDFLRRYRNDSDWDALASKIAPLLADDIDERIAKQDQVKGTKLRIAAIEKALKKKPNPKLVAELNHLKQQLTDLGE